MLRLNGFESYYNFMPGKKIGIWCVGSGMKFHSLSCWAIVMISPVELSTGEFRDKQV